MSETVIAIIDPNDGTVKYEVEGVIGGACEDITKALMESNEVLEHQYTSEYCEEQERPDYVEEQE
jgi:hypothetical protein